MSLERTYRRGDDGPAVAEVRAKLRLVGLLDDTGETGGSSRGRHAAPDTEPGRAVVTATFDEATDRAVRAFQQQRGLPVDGIVGPATYQALDEARWRLGDRILFYVPARLLPPVSPVSSSRPTRRNFARTSATAGPSSPRR